MNEHANGKNPVGIFVMVLALGVVCASGTASNGASNRSVVLMNEGEAFREGRRIGIGTATLKGPKTAEVLNHQSWTIAYTAGKAGMRPGGGIRVALRHMNHLWSPVQNDDVRSAGYLPARSPDNVPISVSVECSAGLLRRFRSRL